MQAASCACAEDLYIERETEQIAQALALIGSIPNYAEVAQNLRRIRIKFEPSLADRAQTSLRHVITLGSEPFSSLGDQARVSLAGTLVHEHWHTRQNPFLKTASFWRGVATRTPPMRRYEWPAYERQIAFLDAVSETRPELALFSDSEKESVLAAFRAHYGF